MWRKRRETASTEDLWSWWKATRNEVIADLDAHRLDGVALHELLSRAERLGLDCEVAPGRVARHAVCFSCNGDPALRRRAHRLVEGAPEADEAVEFHPHRIAAVDPSAIAVRVDGVHAAIADLRFDTKIQADRGLLHIVIHTPAWPEQVRQTVGLLALDAILGEDEVERSIGEITWAMSPTGSSVDADGLRQALSALQSATPEEKTWNILRATDRKGQPALVIVRSRLKPVDYPLFDELVELHIPVPADSEGRTDLTLAQRVEAELTERFTSEAVHTASRTYEGCTDGIRVCRLGHVNR